MADLFLQKGTNLTVNTDLGFALLDFNVAVTEINEDIIIQPEHLFPYYNKLFTAALNSGVISQAVYDAIINNQNESRQVFELNTNVDVQKQDLVDLVDRYRIPNVDTGGGTAAQIVEDIILEGYQIVKKI